MRPPLSSTTIRLSTVPSRSVSVSWTLSPTSLSPCGVSEDDVAPRADLAGLAVPDHLVGGEIIAVAVHAHVAAGGHDVGVAVVGDLVGAELDDLVLVGRGRWRAARARLLRRSRQPGAQGASEAPTTRQISSATLAPPQPLDGSLSGRPIAPQARGDNRPGAGSPLLCQASTCILKGAAERSPFKDCRK